MRLDDGQHYHWEMYPAKSHFSQYVDEWDRLNQVIYGDHPFWRSSFIMPLLRYFCADDIYLAALKDQNDRCCGFLLLRKNKTCLQVYLPSQLQVAPCLIPSSLVAEAVPLLFNIGGALGWRLQFFNQDPLFSTILDQTQFFSLFDISQHCKTTFIDIQGDFDRYWNSRSKNLRKNIKRKFNLIDRNFSSYRLEKITESPLLENAFVRYCEMETSSWKADSGTHIGQHNIQGDFYRDILLNFFKSNDSFIYELYFEDDLAASRLCIAHKDYTIILKTSYYDKYSEYSPSYILLYLLLKKEFLEKTKKKIEFYTNASSEQISWSTGTRSIVHCEIYKNQVFYYGRFFYNKFKKTLKSLGFNHE